VNVFTLPGEISMKYVYITIITNKHFAKIKKKHFRPTLQLMVGMTLNYEGKVECYVNHSL